TATIVKEWYEEGARQSGRRDTPQDLAVQGAEMRALVDAIRQRGPKPSVAVMWLVVDEAGDQVDVDALFGAPPGSWVKESLPDPTPEVYEAVLRKLCEARGCSEGELFEGFIQSLAGQANYLERRIKDLLRKEDLLRRAEEVPDMEDMNKVLRYEAHLSKRISQTIDQL